MDLRPFVPVLFIVAAVLALAFALVLAQRRGWIDASPDRVRRGTGHALLGLQELVEPSVENVLRAEQAQPEQEDATETGSDDIEATLRELADSLSATPIDPAEVRRHLSVLARSGQDWCRAYEQAVATELAARPYRAPSIPPASRVKPIS